MTDGGDWKNPEEICDSIENFSKIIMIINNYSELIENSEFLEEDKESVMKAI